MPKFVTVFIDAKDPDRLSTARCLAFLWGVMGASLAAVVVILRLPELWHIVGELLAASAAALGFRTKS